MKGIIKLLPFFIIFFAWLYFARPAVFEQRVPFPSTYLVGFFTPWSSLYGGPVKNNAMPDVITQIYPWKRVTIESWKQGQIPLWNPYSFSGTQHAGNYQTAVFSPLNVLFFLMDEKTAWTVLILLQPLLAGLFMYMFIRSLALGNISAVLAAVSFMFCGFLVVWMAYGTLGYSALYLPLALFAINKYTDHKKDWGLPLLSISVAFSFFSGHLQISLYVLGFIIFYIMVIKQKNHWLVLFMYLLLGLLLAAPQILPAYDAFIKSGRSEGITKGEIIPWQYLITFFAPDFYGNPVTRNDWFGHYAEWSGFIGVVALFFAFGSLLYATNKKYIYFFGFSSLVTMLFATPSFLNEALYILHIPILSNSSASRIIVLTSFSLCVLSAYGIDGMYAVWHKPIKASVRWLGMSSAFVLILWIVLFFVRPFDNEKLSIAIRNSIVPTGIYVFTIVVVITGFFIHKKYRPLLLVLFIFLASADVIRFATKWMPYDPAEYIYPKVEALEKIKELSKHDQSRIFGNIGGEVGNSFGLLLIDGYDAVYQKRYGEIVASIRNGVDKNLDRSVVAIDKHGIYTENLLQLLGVKYYFHKKSDGQMPWAYPLWEYDHYALIWEDDNFQIYVNKKALPRVFLSSEYIVSDSKEIDYFSHFSDNPYRIQLEKNPSIIPKAGEGEVKIIKYTPNEVILRTDASAPKLLFLSDVYDQGWHVSVDNKNAELLRANLGFRGVALSEGEHVVRMQYYPKMAQIGIYLFGFATIVLLLLGFRKKLL